MTVGLFTLVLVAGLAGPFLSAVRFLSVPVVVGEILAGVIIGNSWLGLIDVGDPLAKFLSDLGFAVLMFGAGMHVPIHDRRLRGATAAADEGKGSAKPGDCSLS